MKFSVIIPTYNAQESIIECLGHLRLSGFDLEIIIADGGSSDATLKLLGDQDVSIVSSVKGRGVQLNEGASRARGDILLFLHADTMIPKELFTVIETHFKNEGVYVAKCGLQFDRRHWLFTCFERAAKLDSLWTSFGDQGIVVRSDFFKKLGGFPDWPLMEDICFFQKARKLTRVKTLPVKVITSAKRFVRNGVCRQFLGDIIIILKYLLGVSPMKLAKDYENDRRKHPSKVRKGAE